jgi:hypothetical protein
MLRLRWKSGSLAEGISSHDSVNRPLDDPLTNVANPRSRS